MLLSSVALASQVLGDNAFYFGDLHVHTGYSLDAGSSDVGHCAGPTGCGAFADVFDDARANGLDFVAMADHLNGFRAMSDTDWPIYLAATLAADDPDHGFVTIPGGEIWSDDPLGALGHHTLLLWEDAERLTPLTLEQARHGPTEQLVDCDELWGWARTLSDDFGAISLIPHHPATADPNGIDWRCFNADFVPSVEIYSRHGNSLEAASAWDVPGAGVIVSGYVSAALDPEQYNLSFGFAGGTDAHDTRPGATCQTDGMIPAHVYGGGLTGVVLDAGARFDRMAIRDAMIERRTYATSGPMVPFDLSWNSGARRLGGLGATLQVADTGTLGVSVKLSTSDAAFAGEVLVVGPLDTWALTFDGVDTWTGEIPAPDLPEWLYVRVEIDAAWYGDTPCDDGGSDDGEYLWSSPSFITRVDGVEAPPDVVAPVPEERTCGAVSGGGFLAFGLAFLAVRYRRAP